jgi:hypothetical protein
MKGSKMDAVKLFKKSLFTRYGTLKGEPVRYKTAELLDLQSASVSCVSEYRKRSFADYSGTV